MKNPRVNVSHFFQVNEVLFYLSNLFVFLGLIIYTVKDIQTAFLPLGLADFIVMIVQITLLILVFTGGINRNSSMAVLLILSIFLFQLSAFVNSSAGGNVSLQIAITTFISLLFASLAAFTVSKHMALAVGGVNLVFFLGITLLYRDQRMMDDMVFFSIIIVGYSIAMYYYRHSLESLAQGLYNSYQTVKKQKYELEVLKEKAERINEVNRPFVIFGKNTSGLVHDFKNDVGILAAGGQLLRMKLKQQQEITLEDVESLESHIQRLSERIETIKYVVSASNYRESERIPVRKLVTAALYPFRLAADLKNRIVFGEFVEDDPIIEASRYRLVQILENLIRNSCEAIVDHQDELRRNREDSSLSEEPSSVEELLRDEQNLGHVRVRARMLDGALHIAVEDNGPGISFCNECTEQNCLSCANFEIGKSTKVYGSGIGMVNVIEAVEQLRGGIKVTSRADRGVKVEILLPPREENTLPGELLEKMGFSAAD